MNRTLRWATTGIDYESDSKHASSIVQECEVSSGRASKVPGTAEKETHEADEALTSSESTRYRAVAARMNYLAMDRVDLQYAAKDLSRKMSAPTRGDWERARKTARYVKYRPRAVQHLKFEHERSELSGHADSDWAGEKSSMKSKSHRLCKRYAMPKGADKDAHLRRSRKNANPLTACTTQGRFRTAPRR